MPASEPKTAMGFFTAFDPGAHVAYDEIEDDGDSCAFTSVTTKLGEGDVLVKTDVHVRAVHNPSARVGAYSVAHWESYVNDVHREYTGMNVGWDRYLDNHLGMAVETPAKLETFLPLLEVRS
jgi:hypothetical protein